jgi:hypothetical protein
MLSKRKRNQHLAIFGLYASVSPDAPLVTNMTDNLQSCCTTPKRSWWPPWCSWSSIVLGTALFLLCLVARISCPPTPPSDAPRRAPPQGVRHSRAGSNAFALGIGRYSLFDSVKDAILSLVRVLLSIAEGDIVTRPHKPNAATHGEHARPVQAQAGHSRESRPAKGYAGQRAASACGHRRGRQRSGRVRRTHSQRRGRRGPLSRATE